MRTRLLAAALLVVLVSSPGIDSPRAQERTTLRVAILTPRTPRVVLWNKRWNRQLARATGDRVRVRMYYGGVAGEERDVVRKIRLGQLDGAALLLQTISQFVRQALVMNAPMAFRNYRQIEAVREKLGDRFGEEAYRNGFKVLGWGDVGLLRLFSVRPVRRLTDFRRMRPWLWRESPLMKKFYSLIGATGVPLGIRDVYGGLQTGVVDVTMTSAVGALAMQWHARTRYVSASGRGFVNGALVLSRRSWEALPADVQRVLARLAAENNGRVQRWMRQADRLVYRRLLARGLTPVELEDIDRWELVGRKLRESMVGRLYTRPLLRRVEAIIEKYENAAPPEESAEPMRDRRGRIRLGSAPI
jgi:TRAP-type C4-dicarboxylate transport system substrate-binding protein